MTFVFFDDDCRKLPLKFGPNLINSSWLDGLMGVWGCVSGGGWVVYTETFLCQTLLGGVVVELIAELEF